LSAVQQEFRQLSVQASWVRESGFHLTLKFLGEVEPPRIERIVSCMVETSRMWAPFSVTVAGVGLFPQNPQPRILWAGIQDVSQHLGQLQQTMDFQLACIGFPRENRLFRPHLTLARLKRIDRWEEFKACVARHADDTLGRMDVGRLELLESQLHSTGAHYSTLSAVPLSG
ncbi:MAG: RNA 2',3'-cyclic phosphodiesterase, partial [Candidatus Entotheonellia bacterium]